MGVYNKNAGKPGRKPNWWVRYWVQNVEVREPGRGGRAATAAFLAEIERQKRAGTWVHPRQRRGGVGRFDNYARKVVARRAERGVSTAAKDEAGHVENHLIPAFGKLEVREMTFARIRDGFAKHIIPNVRGGRTVRNIHSTLRSILVEAADDGLIDNPPLPLSVARGHLPPPVDVDENWRDDAIFAPEEIAALATCEAIPSSRVIMYLTWFLTGSRFSEIVELKVRHYNRQKLPLHSLSVHAAKVARHKGKGRRRREVPVHPDLARWLDWWLASEYEILHGKRPGPDDLLFPTLSKRRLNAGKLTASHGEVYKQWQRHDLPKAGLRHRRLHDARRTLLSALKNAGVDNDIRRRITHYSVEDRVLAGYTTLDWKVLCDAISLLRWGLPEPAPSRIRFLQDARATREIKGSQR